MTSRVGCCAAVFVLFGCGTSSGGGSEADADVDSDADSDVDSDADTDTFTNLFSVHVRGFYKAGVIGGGNREVFYSGFDGGRNETDQSGTWPDIFADCNVQNVGGALTASGYVSNKPIEEDIRDRQGIQLEESTTSAGVTDPYLIRLWYSSKDFVVDSQAPVGGQELCTTLQVTVVDEASFQVDFECTDMFSTYEPDGGYTEGGTATFSNCD